VLSIEFVKIRGRKASEAWHTAFGVSKDISILKRESHGHCIHCSSLVKHHGKSELVVSHLKKCGSFNEHFEVMKRKMMPDFMQDDEITTKKQTKITKYTLPALTSEEQSKFENLLACHYYATGTSFLRVDCPFLHWL
jgi:hypothetical protein